MLMEVSRSYVDGTRLKAQPAKLKKMLNKHPSYTRGTDNVKVTNEDFTTQSDLKFLKCKLVVFQEKLVISQHKTCGVLSFTLQNTKNQCIQHRSTDNNSGISDVELSCSATKELESTVLCVVEETIPD